VPCHLVVPQLEAERERIASQLHDSERQTAQLRQDAQRAEALERLNSELQASRGQTIRTRHLVNRGLAQESVGELEDQAVS
jgi:hypothetical protein